MLERMKKVLTKVLPDAAMDAIDENTSLQEDLGLNSMSLMIMALGIEDEFGITFDEAGAFTTVGDVCAYIEDQQRKNEAAV